jgi:histidine kinase/DNA gyrase B/HSP90-like ATPase
MPTSLSKSDLMPQTPPIAGLTTGPTTRFVRYVAGHRHWVVLGMLGLLQLALLGGVQDPLSRTLLLAHMGLFLLWQPLWRAELRLTPVAMGFIVSIALAVLLGLNWWLVALWLGVLFGVVGGRAISQQAVWLRLFYLGVVVYLLALLLVWVVPHLVGESVTADATRYVMSYVLPGMLLAMAFMPAQEDRATGGQVVDLFYSLMLFLVVMALVLGVFAVMTIQHMEYLLALVKTLFMMGALLMLVGWLWNPRFGFAGLQQMFSAYLLNVGTPFEHWLNRIARAAELEKDPSSFLAFAAQELTSLPWVRHVAWQAPDGEGRMGEEGGQPARLEMGDLKIDISTRYATSPAMAVHIRLLVQIVWRFYEAKRREKAMRQMARLQAIHETGARLTHDVKNLLQSLYGLATAAEHSAGDEAYQQLLRRQLPLFTRRLESTVGKLRAPQPEAESERVGAQAWWDGVRARYDGRDIGFQGDPAGEQVIPKSLFDSVLENLLDNARQKQLAEPGIKVRVAISTGEAVVLTVSDSGSPVPEKVSRVLFQATVDSENGLGIGLYQCGRWADQEGYRLRLRENAPGNVCFELAGPVSD